MLVAALVVLFLILVNALYVAAEFAAVGARRSRVRRLAEDGNWLAARILPVLEDGHKLDRYIAVCQVGITVSSLVLGAYGQAQIAPRITPLLVEWGGLTLDAAQSTAAVGLLLTLTATQMVFGELVPKSLALQYPTQVALATVLPMEWSLKISRWAIAILNGSGFLILKALKVPVTGHRHVHSPEEIELLIAESRDGGFLEPREQVRLHRALRLGLRTARELMVPRIRLAAADESMPFVELLTLVAESPYSRFPVYRGSIDQVVGVLHTKDLVAAYVQAPDRASVRSLLRPLVRVPETMPADKLLAFLREKRSHQAVVCDEFGGVAGLITLEDVLAELLGGISDEFKTTQVRELRLPDGRVRLPGTMKVEQAAALTGGNWAGIAETVAGVIAKTLGRVPAIGERLLVAGVPVEIDSVDGDAVTSVIVGTPPARREGRP